MGTGEELLKVRDLEVAYGPIQALRKVSLRVDQGQVVALAGANGAGKSTLLLTLAAALKPQKGEILFRGQPLAKEAHLAVAQGISLVPERRRLYANLTVRENLLLGAHLQRNKKTVYQDLEEMLRLFPILGQRLEQYAGTLSGGEQQMAAIARGLMSRPALLLLDEPSLGLAPLVVRQMFEIIAKLREKGITVLLAEQNAYQALELADYAYVLESGTVALEGRGKDLLKDSRVRQAYLGLREEERAEKTAKKTEEKLLSCKRKGPFLVFRTKN